MILGLGVDIISPVKIKRAVEQWGDDFLNRVFSEDEVKKIAKNRLYYQRIAARFAAKEAVIKSLGKKIPLAFKDIVITNLPSGAPVCRIDKDGVKDIEVLISITHIEDYAVATAVAQKKSRFS